MAAIKDATAYQRSERSTAPRDTAIATTPVIKLTHALAIEITAAAVMPGE